MALHNKIGRIGERIVEKDLRNKKFEIINTNYNLGRLEIDIIAKKDGILHIIEVKTVSCENIHDSDSIIASQNFTDLKQKHIMTAAQLYMNKKGNSIDVKVILATVLYSCETKQAKVEYFDAF